MNIKIFWYKYKNNKDKVCRNCLHMFSIVRQGYHVAVLGREYCRGGWLQYGPRHQFSQHDRVVGRGEVMCRYGVLGGGVHHYFIKQKDHLLLLLCVSCCKPIIIYINFYMYFTIFNDQVFQFLSLYRSLNKTTGLKLEHF